MDAPHALIGAGMRPLRESLRRVRDMKRRNLVRDKGDAVHFLARSAQ